ncbi:unnamed protein product [Miscanthus lutarioriparius]|uniref:Protein TILLER ANGLE CONTROL 1 n=1 Tax=Miscanthus lutarioriparius TaxID=422564 RepID=A0A811N383_9POAL|nr:unnamed protein product [Miscanthus lutarioriparius]
MGLKVFHWLNRRMHPNTEYCTIHANKAMEDKEDSVPHSVVEKDTEALLLRDVLLNGILAIGTLGHHVDSFCPEACIEEDDLLVMGDEKVIEEEKDDKEPRNDQVKEDIALETEPCEPVLPIVEPAKMHSLSMKEGNFTCFVTEEILIHEVEDGGAANIQERPLLMVEEVEKVRTTLADLFAAEVFSSSAPGENSCQDIIDVAGASTSKHTSCMDKMHQKKPRKPTPKPLKATRKLSRVMRKMLGKKIHPEQLNGRSNAEGPLTA